MANSCGFLGITWASALSSCHGTLQSWVAGLAVLTPLPHCCWTELTARPQALEAAPRPCGGPRFLLVASWVTPKHHHHRQRLCSEPVWGELASARGGGVFPAGLLRAFMALLPITGL